jgi:nicotinamide-nucleotide amidase
MELVVDTGGMKTEILAVGSELVRGIHVDTNSPWLSRRLVAEGIDVHFHTVVGDQLTDNVDAFRRATERAELVIATGGLGPTADDLTRDVLAQVSGVPLVLDSNSLSHIEEMFRKRNRPMPERNRVQAMFPAGAAVIPNSNGTAPGIAMRIGRALVICLPGVPLEMRSMFDDWVLPRLREQRVGGRAILERTIHCFGSGESHIEEKLGDLTRRGRQPEVGITASEATISIRITAAAESPDAARAAIESDAQFVRDRLGDLVYGEDEDELYTVVARLLELHGCTLATAESCTGGLLGHLITLAPGISRFYRGGIVAYANEVKAQFLGVPDELLERHGAVSAEVAVAMAHGCRERFRADLGVSVTGVAGPGGGSSLKPVGLVYVALAHDGGVETAQYNWLADRAAVKLRSAKTALNLIRLHLLRRSR